MDRFIVVNFGDAQRLEYPDIEDYYRDDFNNCIYETDGEKPVRLVAVDGYEPEDCFFHRDLNWILSELNGLAAQVIDPGGSRVANE